MKKSANTIILLLLLGLFVAAFLPSCETGGGSLTFGYTGRAQDGSNYVIGLNVPLGIKKPAAEPVLVQPQK